MRKGIINRLVCKIFRHKYDKSNDMVLGKSYKVIDVEESKCSRCGIYLIDISMKKGDD